MRTGQCGRALTWCRVRCSARWPQDEYYAGYRKRTFEHNEYDKHERRWNKQPGADKDGERSSPYSSGAGEVRGRWLAVVR